MRGDFDEDEWLDDTIEIGVDTRAQSLAAAGVRIEGRDKRKTGEGALKGWATRRQREEDRRVAIGRLTTVAEEMTGELVTNHSGDGYPKMLRVSPETILNWRDRLISATRILEDEHVRRGAR